MTLDCFSLGRACNSPFDCSRNGCQRSATRPATIATAHIAKPPRPSRSLESMPICQCGERAKVEHSSDWRNALDRELGQVSRTRTCPSCGNRWRTVEIRESELQALRLDAYRWRRGVPSVPLSP